MLILAVEEAKAGMTLAAPVTHPDHPDQDLLKAGYVLIDEVLGRLRGMGVAFVYVDYPGLDDLDRHLAVNLSPARQKLYKQIKETIGAGQRRTKPAVSYIDYYATSRELITTLMDQGQHPIYIEHMSRMGADAVTHAAAVAHLSLLLGIKLEPYLIAQRQRLPAHHAKEVVNLGVAGMLHDMGKLNLPEELQRYTGASPPEDEEQLRQWQEHSRQGYEMVRAGIEPSAAAAVLHHHQHFDGSGFPATVHRDGTRSHLAAKGVHVFARIIAVADLYDRLATPMDDRQRRPNLQVLHLMKTRYASWCDPVVLRMLESIAPPFPPGSMLTLSDGTCAVVVDVGTNDPYRPIIKRITDDNLTLDEKRVDLRAANSPTITHVGKVAVQNLISEKQCEPAMA